MSIPKKIHYVWVGEAEMPERERGFIEGWRRLNPRWEIRRWSEKDIDVKRFPLVARALREKRWALAADIIRMYAVFTEGGVYLDTDVELLKGLDFLREYEGFAGWEADFWFTTAVFGAEKGSQWIGKVLQRYEGRDEEIRTETFLKTVHSPSVYAEEIYGVRLDGRTAEYARGRFKVFAREYFSPKHYMTGVERVTERTVARHHYDGTWHKGWERVKNGLARRVYGVLGARWFKGFERRFNRRLARKIRKELP